MSEVGLFMVNNDEIWTNLIHIIAADVSHREISIRTFSPDVKRD